MRDSKYFDLIPTNGRKSFNGKAKVHQYTNDANKCKSELLSYNTKIVVYSHEDNKIIWLAKPNHITKTSMIHINCFLEFYGFDKMTKKEILNQL